MALQLPEISAEGRSWLWPGLAALITLFLLVRSVVNIAPGEAAVRINDITGSEAAVVTPGWTMRLPFVHAEDRKSVV